MWRAIAGGKLFGLLVFCAMVAVGVLLEMLQGDAHLVQEQVIMDSSPARSYARERFTESRGGFMESGLANRHNTSTRLRTWHSASMKPMLLTTYQFTLFRLC
jgi:hypothetical protein